jgi:serine/threonine protein phosphatase 1
MMMPKFFICSDIHSFYTPLKKALDEKGFDPNNENHWLVVCGDAFDRGDESKEVLYFLMSLERKILVRGNHDILLEECCMREFSYSYDSSNGTRKTIQDLGEGCETFDECCRKTWNRLARYRELLVNYFETQNYIFVHSWIPTNIVCDDASKMWSIRGKEYTYNPDWRNANDVEWEEAMWGNPFNRHFEGLNQTGKTIVFGHWHCSTGHKMLGHCKNEFDRRIEVARSDDGRNRTNRKRIEWRSHNFLCRHRPNGPITPRRTLASICGGTTPSTART